MEDKACRLLQTLVQFCHNAGAPLASTTMTVERAHARPHRLWINIVFDVLLPTESTAFDVYCLSPQNNFVVVV